MPDRPPPPRDRVGDHTGDRAAAPLAGPAEARGDAAAEVGAVTTYAIDDEPLARQQIADLVAQVPWARHLGEAGDGCAGLEAVHALRPDVLFLDIQMPELSGLDVAARLAYAPAVIFTTAHERYAVTAFELEAVDYLLKPFGRRRFLAALERARRAVAARARQPADAPDATPRRPAPRDDARRADLLGERLLIRDRGAIVPVPLAHIERLEAEDDYVAVVARGRRYLMAARLRDLATELPPGRFLRVHRSHVVNLDFVERLVPFDAKRLEVHLRDGTRILASRASSEMLRRRAR
ncbi:MAG TPA: LytTR family DNA-binding domain-containing protein [Gemmatimonadaceae bacterium]|nr:LytTR family DNA-binding domain-containing protein [Gemmatimonadaceae bacterium]